MDSLNKDDIRKLCWATTSGTSHVGKVAGHMEGRGENFDLIYTMGHKPSKYMARHVFKAKAFDRDCATYGSEFTLKPSPAEFNRGLCESYSVRGNKPLVPTKSTFALSSTHQNTFLFPSTEETMSSTTANMSGKFSVTNVFKNKDTMVSKSQTQTMHHGQFPKTTKVPGGEPQGNLSLSSFSSSMNSTYRTEHNGGGAMRRTNSEPMSVSAFKNMH